MPSNDFADALPVTDRPEPGPIDVPSERALLGACLGEHGPAHFDRVRDLVVQDDFGDSAHRVLWLAIVNAHRAGRLDPIGAFGEVRELGLESMLTLEYVEDLPFYGLGIGDRLEAHAERIASLGKRRRLARKLMAAGEAVARGSDPEGWLLRLDELRNGPDGTAGARSIGDVMGDALSVLHDRAEGTTKPVATPWPELNALLGGGLLPGVHFLVGGTGSGKTQLALQLALAAAHTGQPVVYVALEMGHVDLVARLLALETREPWSAVFRGEAGPLGRAMQREKALRALPLSLDFPTSSGWPAERLGTLARRCRPALMIIDFVQLVAAADGREDPRARLGRVAYQARAVGRDLGVAVLAISSTSRANYEDLVQPAHAVDAAALVGAGKESGDVEYAADTVLVLGREAANDGPRWLAVAKQRAGRTGVVELAFDGHRYDAPHVPVRTPIALPTRGRR